MTIIGARYNPESTVTAVDLNILARCVRTLLDHRQSLCTDHLERLKDNVYARFSPYRTGWLIILALPDVRIFLGDYT